MKKIIITSLVLFSPIIKANVVVSEGMLKNITCASVMYSPDGKVQEQNDFKSNYYDAMPYSITKSNNKYYMTTGLYSGQFSDVYPRDDKFVFVQFYNSGTEVVTMVFNKGTFTYSNISGTFFNRLCTGTIENKY
ncbi:hypothetical protein [Photobacterium leiognathi]|uniref:hypothetical protein n=1 Tax=Photobacterium leiognathi TaxID=553611 RepID=UPI000D1620B4|nr:hypothetical protein [Photobacterium leiognathi]PSW42635.1 hypothetical protein C0W40_15330 [Photobacterium leiognathi subsp. mandapamensis]